MADGSQVEVQSSYGLISHKLQQIVRIYVRNVPTDMYSLALSLKSWKTFLCKASFFSQKRKKLLKSPILPKLITIVIEISFSNIAENVWSFSYIPLRGSSGLFCL